MLPAAAVDGDGVPYRGRLDLTVTDNSMDGDILVVTGLLGGNAAHLDPLTAVGTFTFVGGTGRFEHAAGDGDFAADFSSLTEGTVDVDATLFYVASDLSGQ